MPRWFVVLGCVAGLARGAAGEEPGRTVEFNRDVRPILSNHCFTCHGPDAGRRQADLRLDTRDGLFAAASTGDPLVQPGKPEESELWIRVCTTDPAEQMPPAEGKPLTGQQRDILKRWITEGAAWQGHWSLQPPRRPAVPEFVGGTSDHPIDRFLQQRLAAEGLAFSPEADRATLLRRLSFDLIGLPPTPDELDAFLEDDRPDAYARQVERLLASPHFGERLAMMWLDLVRYADTVGYHGDQERAISPYRDYVINAFNANLPFDRFTIEQLAGDLLPDATLWQQVASGYNMLGMTTIEGGAQEREYLAKYAADRVRTTSTVWMGATLGCAECHDHKYDPYKARDFYRFAAFFADIREKGVGNPPADLSVPDPRQAAELAALDAEIQRLTTSDDQDALTAAQARRSALVKTLRQTIQTVSVAPRTMRVLPRGDWLNETGEVVTAGVPEALQQLAVEGRPANRLDLARWLVAPDHPQTSRVFVNRLWKIYFGGGLTRTLDDVGSQGDWPVQLDLLDWLAVEFVESGWDVKHLVRLLVTSSAYRQVSTGSPERLERDPQNRLWSRQGRFRLDAELIRDQALAVSGLLVRELGGESAKPYQPAGYYAFLNFPTRDYTADQGPRQYRRGVYTHWQRTFLHPFLIAFDAPSREECTAERPQSNTPQAALVLLNDPSIVEAARVFAVQILEQPGTDDARLARAWRTATSRPPTSRELAALQNLLAGERTRYQAAPGDAQKLLDVGLSGAPTLPAPEVAAWTSVTRVLLNLTETITRP